MLIIPCRAEAIKWWHRGDYGCDKTWGCEEKVITQLGCLSAQRQGDQGGETEG